MEIDALTPWKGGGGRGKGGGGKGKGKDGKGGKGGGKSGGGGKAGGKQVDGKGGKGAGKETRECWVCGKPGHLSSACWHNPSNKTPHKPGVNALDGGAAGGHSSSASTQLPPSSAASSSIGLSASQVGQGTVGAVYSMPLGGEDPTWVFNVDDMELATEQAEEEGWINMVDSEVFPAQFCIGTPSKAAQAHAVWSPFWSDIASTDDEDDVQSMVSSFDGNDGQYFSDFEGENDPEDDLPVVATSVKQDVPGDSSLPQPGPLGGD